MRNPGDAGDADNLRSEVATGFLHILAGTFWGLCFLWNVSGAGKMTDDVHLFHHPANRVAEMVSNQDGK
jgi:hypothetical protein